MIRNPPATGSAELDRFLSSVKDALDTATKPTQGWKLSDFHADVSEVISDKRDLIDIVSNWSDVTQIKATFDAEIARYEKLYADSKILGDKYQDHAEIFAQIMEWWAQNVRLIEDIEEFLIEVNADTSAAASSASAAATSEANADESENVALDASAAAIVAAITVTGGPRGAKIHIYDGSGTPSLDDYPDAQVGDVIERLSDGERWKVEQ